MRILVLLLCCSVVVRGESLPRPCFLPRPNFVSDKVQPDKPQTAPVAQKTKSACCGCNPCQCTNCTCGHNLPQVISYSPVQSTYYRPVYYSSYPVYSSPGTICLPGG